MNEMWIIDTGFKKDGLEKRLSNLCTYPFVIDDVECGGIEGFLQSLKIPDQELQKNVAKTSGFEAWKVGQNYNDWKIEQILFWKGEEYPRLSKKYQRLLERAYDACFEQSVEFATALAESEDAILAHTMGKRNPSNTTLTEQEYIYNLYRLRARVQQILRKS